MTVIRRYGFFSHARVEASSVLAVYRQGRLVRSGRGLAVWFATGGATSLVEVPADDRDHVVAVTATSADFQTVGVQGTATWRAAEPLKLAERIDFSVDPKRGTHGAEPIAQVETLIDGLIATAIERHAAVRPIATLLAEGVGPLAAAAEAEIAATHRLAAIGVELVGLRLAALTPAPELVRALRQPTLERLQQGADEATFARRAAAVEKEAAIAENETKAKIRLEEERGRLIARERDNELARAEIERETRRIAAEAGAAVQAIEAKASAEAAGTASEAEAEAIRRVDAARVEAERERAEITRSLPPVALIARAIEGGLGAARIGTLNLGPDAVGLIGSGLAEALAGKRG